MKNYKISILSAIIFLMFQNINAQVNGNKKIVTQTFETKDFQSLLIDFPADVVIDCSKESGFEITTDENIFRCIGIKNQDGKLSITQEKWLEASNGVQIKIGAKGLQKLETGGYGETLITNLSNENFALLNPVGNVKLEGTLKSFNFETHKGKIDASELVAGKIDAKITGSGYAQLGEYDFLNSEIHKNGSVKTTKIDTTFGGEKIVDLPEPKQQLPKPKYINIKVQNNSFSLLHTVVEGPPNRNFSYGLAFIPYQKKSEKWPIGTKLYKEKSDGTRMLLTTISKEDEGQTVKIFK